MPSWTRQGPAATAEEPEADPAKSFAGGLGARGAQEPDPSGVPLEAAAQRRAGAAAGPRSWPPAVAGHGEDLTWAGRRDSWCEGSRRTVLGPGPDMSRGVRVETCLAG